MAYRYYHLVVGVEIFGIEFVIVQYNLTAARVAPLVFNFDEFFFYHLAAHVIIAQYFVVTVYTLFYLIVLCMQLFLHKSG